MATQSTTDQSERRHVYERVLAIVDANTNNTVQGPTMSERSLRTVASHAGLDAGAVRKAIRAARENDGLLTFDRDGQPRLVLVQERPLVATIEAEVERDDTDQDLIGACNDALDALRAGTKT